MFTSSDSSRDVVAVTQQYAPLQLSFPSQFQARHVTLEDEEWEITEIIGKRRIEYKVRWKDTWLPHSDLGNAQDLLREYEAQRPAYSGRKGGKGLAQAKASDYRLRWRRVTLLIL